MKKIVLVFVATILLLGSCVNAPLAEPSVTLLSPNGGETFEKGELGLINSLDHRLMIRWQVNGTFGENAYAVVKIRKGEEPAEILFAQPISPPWNKSEHSWSPYSIPDRFEPGDDYKIEIVPVLSEKKDVWKIEMKEVAIDKGDTSDGYFSIIEREGVPGQQSEPLVTILSPNGGERLIGGTTYPVKISIPADNQYEISFNLYDGNAKLGSLMGIRPDETTFNWIVGKFSDLNGNATLAHAGQNYRIGLIMPGIEDPVDFSDSPFSIEGNSITLLSPNGGEDWAVGETRRVSWQLTGAQYVRIYIYDDTVLGSGSTNYIYDGTFTADVGYYDWTIERNQLPGSDSLPRQYRIRIDGLDETAVGAMVLARDSSDDLFYIWPPEYNPPAISKDELQAQINALLAQLAALQKKLEELQ